MCSKENLNYLFIDNLQVNTVGFILRSRFCATLIVAKTINWFIGKTLYIYQLSFGDEGTIAQ